MKRILALALVFSLVLALSGGQIVWAEETTVTVVADNDSAGNPTWQSATLTTTATEGTYIVKNNDAGAGYSFTWTPANNTISLDNSSAATASEVVVPSKIDGVDVLTVGSKFIKKADEDILKTVVLSEGITTVGNSAFNGYKVIETVKLPSTLIKIGESVFVNCSSLKALDIPADVTSLGYQCFKGAGVESLVIPAGVKDPVPGEMFANCKSLKHLTFEGYVKGFNWGSFSNTSALETMTFKNEKALSSIYTGAMTGSSQNLVVYYPENGTGYDTYEFKSLFIAGTVFRVIGQEPVFDPPIGTVVEAEVVAASDAEGTPSWQSATTTVTDKEGIYILTNVSQGYSFKWLPDIKTIMLDADSAGAENVVIPSQVNGTEVLTLAEKIIPKADPEVLKTVVISEGITSGGINVLSGHTLLETIVLPSTITKLGENSFTGCKNLRNIELPEGLKSIGYQSFKNTSIIELVFPSTYDNNIQGDMFSGCKNLKTVIFKGYLKTINWSTFFGCSALEELVFLDATPPSSIDKSAFNSASTNFVVYYPEGATDYEAETFQAKFPEGVTFAVYPSNYTEITKVINNGGTYELEYEIRVSDENSDAAILIALYNGNTLVNCKTVSASSTSTTITANDANQVKMFLWESADSITPLCNAAVAKIEPAAPRGRVYNANGTVVTAEGDLLRGMCVETDYSTSAVTYAQLAEMKNYGCNTLHLYAERQSAKLEAGYSLELVDQYVEMTEELGLYLVLTAGDSTLNKEFDLAFWEIYAPRYKDKTHVIYEVQNESNGFNPPTEQYLADLKEVHDKIRSLAPDTHILLFSFSHLRSVEDIDGYMAAMDIDDWSKTAIAWHGYDSNPPDYAKFVNHLRDNGYASINTELPADINGYANETLLRTMEELDCSWIHFVNVSNVKNDKYWTTPIEKGGISWDSDFGMWPETGVKSAHQFTQATDYDAAVDVNVEGEYVAANADGGYIAFDKYNFATAPAMFDAYVSEDSNGTIALYLDSLTSDPVATLNVTAGSELQYCAVPEITGKHMLYLIFTGDISLSQFRFVDQPVNPYETLEAEDYTEQQGVDRGSSGEGGMAVNAIQENDYIAFDNVDFGTGATSCDMRISSVYTTSKAQLRIDSLDGPVIGEIELPITGGWDTYNTYSGAITGAEGRHKLYVIFIDGSHGGGYCNVNWLKFNQ